MSKQRLHLIAVVAVLAVFAQPSLAWQERSVGGDSDKSTPDTPNLPTPNLNLNMPDLSIGKDTGTELRIPGIGSIGVLPKFDLGLELLYGANDPGGRPDDKSQPSDVQLRATLKHRF